MHKLLTLTQRENFLYMLAGLASILLSVLAYYRVDIINPDAICYLTSAEIYGQQGLAAAMHICGQAKWPFYSILIYYVCHFLSLPYAVGAYVIDGIFSLLSVLLFIAIVKQLGATRRILWLAALTILLAHTFNDMREEIVRDHGFWTFYLLSLLSLLRYFRQPQLTTATMWSMSLIIAALFRIEAIAFICLLPFLSWFDLRFSAVKRLQHFCILIAPLIILASIAVLWYLLQPQQIIIESRLPEVMQQLQHGLTAVHASYQLLQANLAKYILINFSANQAPLLLPIFLVVWYVVNIIQSLSWSYTLLLVYAYCQQRNFFTPSGKFILAGYALINIIITFTFLVQNLFLTKRYLTALILIVMLQIPFAIDMLLNKFTRMAASGTPRKTLIIHWSCACIISMIILFSALPNIFKFSHGKAFVYQAGHWLADKVPANAKLYVNDEQLMYYSQHFRYDIFTKWQQYEKINLAKHDHWQQYDYIALRINKKEMSEWTPILAKIQFLPVQHFNNKRGDQVIIFSRQH